jgi:hypothetical protein
LQPAVIWIGYKARVRYGFDNEIRGADEEPLSFTNRLT